VALTGRSVLCQYGFVSAFRFSIKPARRRLRHMALFALLQAIYLILVDSHPHRHSRLLPRQPRRASRSVTVTGAHRTCHAPSGSAAGASRAHTDRRPQALLPSLPLPQLPVRVRVSPSRMELGMPALAASTAPIRPGDPATNWAPTPAYGNSLPSESLGPSAQRRLRREQLRRAAGFQCPARLSGPMSSAHSLSTSVSDFAPCFRVSALPAPAKPTS
jgi:hypothetical protein